MHPVGASMNLKDELNTIMNTRRGALAAFCEKHQLDYNSVYRVATSRVSSPSFELGKKIESAISKERE